jgi:RNA polymerase sigma-70 factor (ECF subfamily)
MAASRQNEMVYEKTDRETELIPRLKSGDEIAFADLYDAYAGLIFGTIVRIVGDRREAENLLQDCFIKIWQHIGNYDPLKGRLATWLINIARNMAIDFTRSKYFSQQRKNQSLENLVLAEPENRASRVPEETVGLRQLVKKLSPGCQEVIEWMYFEGFTQQEIADNFGIPLGTVKSRTRLALKELRSFYN